MRRVLALFLVSAFGCSDPQCREGERLVGLTCYDIPMKEADASFHEDAGPAGEATGLRGDGGSKLDKDSEVAVDVQPDAATSLEEIDAAIDAAVVSGQDAALAHEAGSDSGIPDAHANQPACQPSTEVCDGADNDCDDAVDEDNVCCVPTTETCNGKDDDCDGIADNGGAKNECGGPCSTVVINKIGKPCSNDKKGICAASGTFQCKGANTECDAPYIPSAIEKCDGLDNDCNGTVDDATATYATTWTTYCPTFTSDPIVSCEEPPLPNPDCYNTGVL
jgi:hypothetical protein